jgi:hypothetical protein
MQLAPYVFACALLAIAHSSSAAAQAAASAKAAPALAVPISYSLESAALKKAKAVFDGTVWKIDADGVDADGSRRFNVEHREQGAAVYINVTETERVAGFEVDRVLAKWFDATSKYKAQTADVPQALKIGAPWRCAARRVTFTGGIDKMLLLCMQAKGRTTVDFMLGLPSSGWERDVVAINAAIASIGWVEAAAR